MCVGVVCVCVCVCVCCAVLCCAVLCCAVCVLSSGESFVTLSVSRPKSHLFAIQTRTTLHTLPLPFPLPLPLPTPTHLLWDSLNQLLSASKRSRLAFATFVCVRNVRHPPEHKQQQQQVCAVPPSPSIPHTHTHTHKQGENVGVKRTH